MKFSTHETRRRSNTATLFYGYNSRSRRAGLEVARPRHQHRESVFFWVEGFFFLLGTEGLGKTVRYNDTRDVNKRATYFIVHHFCGCLLIRTHAQRFGEGREMEVLKG